MLPRLVFDMGTKHFGIRSFKISARTNMRPPKNAYIYIYIHIYIRPWKTNDRQKDEICIEKSHGTFGGCSVHRGLSGVH